MDNYENNFNQQNQQLEAPMTLGDWLVTLLITAIPCVGLVMLFVWAFSSDVNTSKKNFCRARLIFSAIILVLVFIMYAVLGVAIFSSLANYKY